MASLANTVNHAQKPEFEYEEEFPEWWDWFVRAQAEQMKNYFDTTLKHTEDEGKNPIFFCRFEDLLADPKPELMQLFSFLLSEPDLTGTNCERRIDAIISLGAGATQTYNLKKDTKKTNSNAKRYTTEQTEYIKEVLGKHIYYFGYSNTPEGLPPPNNETSFFDYGNNHKPENMAQYMKFRDLNNRFLE